MRIRNIPFVDDKAQNFATCQGPPTVMMALGHFRPRLRLTFEELYREMGYAKGKWFFETYIVRFLHSIGIKTKYYSTADLQKIGTDAIAFQALCGLDYSNKEDRQAIDIQHYDYSIDFVNKLKLFQKRPIDVDFIKEQVQLKKLVIATVNRNKLVGEHGYKGHFILIKGFDRRNFICEDAFLGHNIRIPYAKFNGAFLHNGNSDMVVVG